MMPFPSSTLFPGANVFPGGSDAALATPVHRPRLVLTIPTSRLEIDVDGYTQHDTGPDLVATLTGTPLLPLTGATAACHLKRRRGNQAAVTIPAGQCTFNPDQRTVTIRWTDGDLAQVGPHELEVEVTYSGGMVQTFPGGVFYVAAELA